MRKPDALWLLLMLIASLWLHGDQLNKQLIGIHLWRQSQTQTNIVNFYRRDFNIFNPRDNRLNAGHNNIVRYEFPVMQWTVAATEKLLNREDIIITRLWLFAIGFGGIWGMLLLLRLIFKEQWVARFGAWAFAMSPVFFYYTVNPLPDVLALSAAVWGMYGWLRYLEDRRTASLLLSAAAFLVATLAKLPYIILTAGILPYLLMHRTAREWGRVTGIFLLFLLPAMLWYIRVIPGWNGNGVLYGITENRISSQKVRELLIFHWEIMFPHILLHDNNLYLLYAGALFGIIHKFWKHRAFPFLVSAFVICLLYLFFELNMIDRVHDYYMMPFLPMLYVVVAGGFALLFRLIKRTGIANLIALVLAVTGAQETWLATYKHWTVDESYTNPVLFQENNPLKNLVSPDTPVIMIDVSGYVYPYKLDKRGYVYGEPELTAARLTEAIRDGGARYLYSESRQFDSTATVRGIVDSLIVQRGTLRLYRLKRWQQIDTATVLAIAPK